VKREPWNIDCLLLILLVVFAVHFFSYEVYVKQSEDAKIGQDREHNVDSPSVRCVTPANNIRKTLDVFNKHNILDDTFSLS
jgi:hypothetical protein